MNKQKYTNNVFFYLKKYFVKIRGKLMTEKTYINVYIIIITNISNYFFLSFYRYVLAAQNMQRI